MNDFALNEGSFFVLTFFFFPVGEDDGQQAKNDFVYKRDEIWWQEINQEQTDHQEKRFPNLNWLAFFKNMSIMEMGVNFAESFQ